MKYSRMFKNIGRILLLAVCGAVLGVNVYMANASKLLGEELPMPFGVGAAVVLSGSMEPEFSTGDLIVVRQADSYRVDDIVVFQEGRSLVVHRIVEMDGDTVTTKGDANNASDPPIEAAAIKGRVLFHIPGAGNVVQFLKTPVGTILVIVAAIALVEIPRRRELQQDDEERKKIIDEINRLKNQE